MNLSNIKSVSIVCAAFICLFAAPVCGQNNAPPTTQTTVTESYELNIVEERITETDFERATAAEIARENLSVKAGASVRAAAINVLLRGITGDVRFRASLERLTARLERLRQKAPNAAPTPP